MRSAITGLLVSCAICMAAQDYTVYVDDAGVMRRDDTNQEVAYYGTNYTVPFAHAYRALGHLGIDHKSAIDRDVYHMARLGFDGFRLHLWDVELSDSVGNLIPNEHLDLLDYLLSQLEKRDIKIVLTAQTNFGNGYPERNTDPNGAYSYDYDKCEVHDNPDAIEAQRRYVDQLLRHVNAYTGRSYADDRNIIAIEINNEPCHSGTPEEVNAYVRTMAEAIRGAGWNKPILYNVSHNLGVTEAFYDDAIDGTTYQWYPLNLVHGATRKGNFLPYVDEYNIPFADVNGFDKKAKIVYEFDPADNLYSYLYPSIARTFRKDGFQWITQFAYDPIDMAWANSEYQTHFLNLAYTPSKALSMMIAAEVTRETPRNADYGKYPVDTIFGDFMVSAKRNLSVMNDGKKLLYTNTNDVVPKDFGALKHVAGVGSSAVVDYPGTGAYFLDMIGDGVWRLEVMPDVVLTSDPFAKPSLQKHVGDIYYRSHPMVLKLPQLNKDFKIKGINPGNDYEGEAINSTFDVTPGVYLISDDASAFASYPADHKMGTMTINEYVAPAATTSNEISVVHHPVNAIDRGKPLTITAIVSSVTDPDSVMVYPGDISFWHQHNRVHKMERVAPYTYQTVIDAKDLGRGPEYRYDIVVSTDDEDMTFPAKATGNPLSWDYTSTSRGYATKILDKDAPIILIDASAGLDGTEISTLPTRWSSIRYGAEKRMPIEADVLKLSLAEDTVECKAIIFKYVADMVEGLDVQDDTSLVVLIDGVEGDMPESINVGVVNADGFTYTADVPVVDGAVKVPLSDMQLSTTYLSPEPYPSFITREFVPDAATATPLRARDIEKVQIIVPKSASTHGSIAIRGVYLER